MTQQLAVRDAQVRDGARQIGWKLGFGSPTALATFGLDRPLVGYLLDRGTVHDGATVALTGWTQPMLEPEIAVHLAKDVDPDASWETVRSCIRGLSAAIELADLWPAPTDVRDILAGNIFHRHVLLGAVDTTRSVAAGIGVSVRLDGREVARTHSPELLTGELVEIVRLTAEGLAGCDERLRAGEVVITGSTVPPLRVEAGSTVETQTDGLGQLRLSLA